MREGEEDRRPPDSSKDAAPGPILENALNEAPVDELFADRNRSHQSEENEALERILGKKFERKLRKHAFDFVRASDQATKAVNLVEQNRNSHYHGDGYCERRVGDGQPQLRRTDPIRMRTPKNYTDGNPLKRDGGGVEREALNLRCVRRFEKLPDAAPAKSRHRHSEKKQDEREIPVHRY
jgi:hypothetical protein